MQTIKKVINPYTVEIVLKESTAGYNDARKKVLENISKHANIKGFRAGSVIPEEIIIKQYGAEVIENNVIEELINDLYSKIIKKENIVPTGPAIIKEIKSNNPFEAVLEIEILPEIEVDEKKLKKIKIKKTVNKVEKNEVEAAITEIEKKFSKFEEIEGSKIELADRITLETQGYDKKGGKELPETKVKSFPLVIGSGAFIPGFEEKLIGAKVGEIVEFDITFPADYHSADFAGRKVYFITNILKIEKAIKPEWTADFIEKLRGVPTDFEGFKKIIEDEILKEKDYQSRAQDEKKLLEELESACKIEIGEHLLNHEIDRVYKEHTDNLDYQGINIAHYLEHIKKDEATYKQEVIKVEALRRLKAELILEKLKTIIEVEVSEKEITDEIEKILSQYSSLEVKEKLQKKLIPGDTYYEDVKSKMKYSKIIDQFFE